MIFRSHNLSVWVNNFIDAISNWKDEILIFQEFGVNTIQNRIATPHKHLHFTRISFLLLPSPQSKTNHKQFQRAQNTWAE